MGRPRKSADVSRNRLLQVRLVADEYQSFRDAASEANLELSVWVRRQLRRAASRRYTSREYETLEEKQTCLGFRVTAKEIFWSAVSGEPEEPILEDSARIKLPKDTELAEQLHYIRTQLLAVIQEHSPQRASVRLQETFIRQKPAPKAFGSMLNRARIEGVLMQTLFEKGVAVWTGGLQAMKTEMGATHSLKEYLSAPDLRGIDLSSMKPEMREAVVAGLAVMED